MLTTIRIATLAAVTCVALIAGTALADDHPYTEGPVVNMQAVRTEYGKFDDYLKYLDGNWKATQEAAKKSGLVLSYRIITVEPRTESDPDIYLITNYKNWAAFDGMTAKMDAILKQVEGSLDTAGQHAVERGKIRRVLGQWTGQELILK